MAFSGIYSGSIENNVLVRQKMVISQPRCPFLKHLKFKKANTFIFYNLMLIFLIKIISLYKASGAWGTINPLSLSIIMVYISYTDWYRLNNL